MKIMIIGSSGSGKSTFARELGKITSYPILHLDKVFHKYPSEIAREKLREATRKMCIRDSIRCDCYVSCRGFERNWGL